MVAALVGSPGAVATGTTTVTPAYGQSPTAGNLLVLFYAGKGPAAPSVPTAPAGWSTGVAGSGGNGSVSVPSAIYYKKAAGGDAAPTITDATVTNMAAVLLEFSGVTDTFFSDFKDKNSASGSGNSSPISSTNSAPDGTHGDLLAANFSEVDSKAGTVTTGATFTDGTGANPTAVNVGQNDATSLVFHFSFWYAVASVGANLTADTVTLTTTSKNISSDASSMVSFAGTAVHGLRPFRVIRQAVKRSTSY